MGISIRADAAKPNISSADGLRRAFLAAKSIAITAPATGGVSGVHIAEVFSVAERSFSFLHRVQMIAKPMPQPLLHGSRQLQDKVHKTQGLEDFKMASGIRDDMRSTATQLFKRQRLTRLVSKMGTVVI
jgi:hypothetical protein